MVDAMPNIRKIGTESFKWRQYGCAIFVIRKTWMTRTGTEVLSITDMFLAACRWILLGPNIELIPTLLIYDIEYKKVNRCKLLCFNISLHRCTAEDHCQIISPLFSNISCIILCINTCTQLGTGKVQKKLGW